MTIIIAIGVFLVYARAGLLASIQELPLADTMLGIPFVILSVSAGHQASIDA